MAGSADNLPQKLPAFLMLQAHHNELCTPQAGSCTEHQPQKISLGKGHGHEVPTVVTSPGLSSCLEQSSWLRPCFPPAVPPPGAITLGLKNKIKNQKIQNPPWMVTVMVMVTVADQAAGMGLGGCSRHLSRDTQGPCPPLCPGEVPGAIPQPCVTAVMTPCAPAAPFISAPWWWPSVTPDLAGWHRGHHQLSGFPRGSWGWGGWGGLGVVPQGPWALSRATTVPPKSRW